ncbi:DUF3515 domain-containing protein [Streptomyces sp. NPDC092296]|uniref:DUF3515 domain-containing protein n=1 Tax=Streptomyces sp. NPDC092296 TaxID=3366012 RepID=UPI0037FC73A7
MTVPARFTSGTAQRRLLLLSAVLVALLACGFLWWRSDPRVEPPTPDAAAAPYCAALDRALPRSVQGRTRQDPQPASPYTAAWHSDPRTVLRCGVPVPRLLIEHPKSDAVTVNDVDWLIERTGDGYRFTTVERRADVEVTVPDGAYPSPTDALPPISDAVRKTIPSRFTE